MGWRGLLENIGNRRGKGIGSLRWTCAHGYTYLFILLYLFIFNGLIALQYWFDFCHTSIWISYRCTYVSSLLKLPPTSHPFPLLQVVTEPWFEFPESYSKFASKNRYFTYVAAAGAKSLQSCPTLRDPIDGNPLGFPVPGILQARVLEWVAIAFSLHMLLLLLSCFSLSDSVRPHRLQATRLPCLWDSPGKNTRVGCHFLQCMKVKSESEVTQSCLTPRDPMDCSLPGSSIHGIFQARVHTAIFKLDNQQGPTVQQGNSAQCCVATWMVWGRMGACICMAGSLYCPPETITTLLISCTRYKIKRCFVFFLKERQ